MESKLRTHSKRLTLWGALVSSLPFLLLSLMVASLFGIASPVPLGRVIAFKVFFKTKSVALFRKWQLVSSKKELGLTRNKAIASHGVSELEESTEQQPVDTQSERRENLEIPLERCFYEQTTELDLAPSTSGNASGEGKVYSTQQSIHEENPGTATEIEPIHSLGMQVSSGCVSEIAVEGDEKIWEEIHTVRKFVGYKRDPKPSYAEEIKALYVFTGVEPPTSLKCCDVVNAGEKLKLLERVLGV